MTQRVRKYFGILSQSKNISGIDHILIMVYFEKIISSLGYKEIKDF
jgi:hypothetical protein